MRNKFLDNIKNILQLSYSLSKTNFKLRNEKSYLGIFWYLLEPLSFFITLYALGSFLGGDNIEKFPLYLFLGIIMFNFFSSCTMASCNIIEANAGFIKSLNISKTPFVFSVLFQYSFSHFFEIFIFCIFMFLLGSNPLLILLYVPIFLVYFFMVAGICFVLSAVGVFVSDISNVWNIFSRILWFLTPIFYFAPKDSFVGMINPINPVYYFIYIAREICIYGRIPSLMYVIVGLFSALISFSFGLILFNIFKFKFAEKL